MSMLNQYRAIREAVREDLANVQQAPPVSKPDEAGVSDSNDEKSEKLPSGVTISRPSETDGSTHFVVGWKDDDPLNPHNWPRSRKWTATATVCLIAMAVCIPGTIDAPVSGQFNEHYDVGPIAGSLTTGIYSFFINNTHSWFQMGIIMGRLVWWLIRA